MPELNNVPLGSEINATFALVFNDDIPFPGHEIVPTLTSLCEHVPSVIEAFASLCEGQAFPIVAAGKPGDSVKTLIIGPTDNQSLLNRTTRLPLP